MSRRVIEGIKSAVLCLLVAIMMALLAVTWNYARGEKKDRSFIRQIYAAFGREEKRTAQGMVTLSPAVYPVTAAAGYEGALCGAAWERDSVAALYERIKPVLAETLGSAGVPEPVTEWEYTRALEGNMVCLSFDGAAPLYALSAWLGAEAPDTLAEAGSARRLLLFAGEEKISLYYFSEESGQYMRAPSAARSKTLLPLLSSLESNGEQFAGMQEEYFLLSPDMLTGKIEDVSVLSAESALIEAGSGAIASVFDAFEFNPYTVRKYEESDGTQAYVESLATIRLSPDGTLVYQAPEEGGIEAEGAAGAGKETDRNLYLMEAAHRLVQTIYTGIGGNSVYLAGFSAGEEETAAYFGCTANGLPIVSPKGYAAVVRFKGDRIMEAEIRLRRYAETGETTPVIPIKQAAALFEKTDKEKKRMTLCYRDDGQSWVRPVWYWY